MTYVKSFLVPTLYDWMDKTGATNSAKYGKKNIFEKDGCTLDLIYKRYKHSSSYDIYSFYCFRVYTGNSLKPENVEDFENLLDATVYYIELVKTKGIMANKDFCFEAIISNMQEDKQELIQQIQDLKYELADAKN